MTFPYIGSNGLFTRLGKIAGMLNNINSFIGTGTLGPEFDTIAGQYTTTDLNLIGGLYSARDSYRGVHTSMQNYLQALAQATVIQMVNDFSPLSKQDLPTALTWLVSQMKADIQSVAKPTVTETVTAGSSNTGTGVLAVSNLNASGVQHDYVFAETIKAVVTKDGQSGGTVGQETFTLTSPVAESNPLQWDWPLGSGISLTQNAVDAQVSNSGGNLLTNGSWNTWTNPTIGPDNWLILSGTVGTDIQESSGSGAYKGNNGLLFSGLNTPSISQPFNTTTSTAGNSGGTPGKLAPLTQYAVNLWIKVGATLTGGTLTVDLTDGSNTALNDASANPNSTSVTLSTVGTSWTPVTVFFRTPAVVPSTGYRLRVHISSGMTIASGTPQLYLGNLAMTTAVQSYPGGPRFALFSGASNFINGDTFSVVITNDRKSGPSSKWQTSADQLFGMKALGLQLPSGGSPTILDSLIS